MTPQPKPVATLLNTVARALEQFDVSRLNAPDAWRTTEHMTALATTLHKDLRIHLGDARQACPANGDTVSPSEALQDAQVPEALSLAAYEKACLARALVYHGGNVILAAEAVGIGKSTMYRRLKDHGLRN